MTEGTDSNLDDPYKGLPRSALIWKIRSLEKTIRKLEARTLDDHIREIIQNELLWSKD